MWIRRVGWRLVGLSLAVASCERAAAPASDPRIAAVRALRAAEERRDFESARAAVDPAAQVWYEKRVGAGEPWSPGGGRWEAWDAEFRSHSRVVGDFQLDRTPWGDAVWAVVDETNDYYRLTERTRSLTMLTWFVDPAGRVTGFLVAGVGESESKRDEFVSWARAHAPDEIAVLMPEGRIDPTGDRPARHRALLERWRKETGRPPVEASPAP